MEYKQCS